jgi:hypothetical protein
MHDARSTMQNTSLYRTVLYIVTMLCYAMSCPLSLTRLIEILARWIVKIAELTELYLEDVVLSRRSQKFAFLRNRLLAVVPHVTQWS